jgi:hypothetical protein
MRLVAVVKVGVLGLEDDVPGDLEVRDLFGDRGAYAAAQLTYIVDGQ